MKISKAIEGLKSLFSEHELDLPNTDSLEILHMAIDALKKQEIFKQIYWERNVAIAQLEEIGLGLGEKTDRVREALEKQNPKKPLPTGYRYGGEALSGKCSICKRMLNSRDHVFCHGCGHKIDWSEINEQRE